MNHIYFSPRSHDYLNYDGKSKIVFLETIHEEPPIVLFLILSPHMAIGSMLTLGIWIIEKYFAMVTSVQMPVNVLKSLTVI